MRIAEIVMALVLAALSLGIMWKAGEAPWGAPRFSNVGFGDTGAPAGGFWPFWCAAIMFICCIWVFVNGLLRMSPPSRSSDPYLDGHGINVLLRVGVPVFVMVLLTDYISIYFAMALFLFYYLFILGRHGGLLSGTMSVVMPFWMFLFFDITMSRNLPKGLRDLEYAIWVPAGNFLRGLDGAVIGLLFLGAGGILVLAAVFSARGRAQ